jgi:hypothetical protein
MHRRRLKRPRLVRIGETYEIEEDVELEEIPNNRNIPDMDAEPWNTSKLPREEWISSGN